jgi:hypothetical protein
MITIKDCEALCDADPNWVHELACRECLTMIQAYASAHEATVCANYASMAAVSEPAPTEYRLAA